MRDEEISQVILLLKILQQIDDLHTHRNIQGRSGLIQHDQVRSGSQRPGHRDALLLPAAEVVWELLQVARL